MFVLRPSALLTSASLVAEKVNSAKFLIPPS